MEVTNLNLSESEVLILSKAVNNMNKGLAGCKIMYTIEHMGSDYFKVTIYSKKKAHLFHLGRIFEYERLLNK